jgi:hypothetical protein
VYKPRCVKFGEDYPSKECTKDHFLLANCALFSRPHTASSKEFPVIKNHDHHQHLEKLNVSKSQYYKNVIPLDYGSFFWTTAHKLIGIKYNSELRISIGAYRLNPIPSIYNLTYTHPLDIRKLKITLNHELKLPSTLPTLDFKPIFQMLPTLLQENNLDISKVLNITSTLILQWKNLIETNTELSIFKKDDIPSSIYKKQYFYII